jgi:hypothetical protein
MCFLCISCFCCRVALVGAHTDQRVLTGLLRKHFPEVVAVFEEMEVGRLALAPWLSKCLESWLVVQ